MAWTTTKNAQFSPGGNYQQQLWELTADSATLELNTGLNYVEHLHLTPISGAASAASFQVVGRKNVLSAGTSSNGYIAVTGATSGQDFYLTVWGR